MRSGISAYQAASICGEPSPLNAGPGWCFDRFGQSSTLLPDNRTVLIGGEHEDFYDPDFYIYNDVVVRHPDGLIDIFGYPREFFPPTDFHTATLVGDRIIIIGNLSYPDQRKSGITQVLVLELKTFSVNKIQTSGISPGWLHKHQAKLTTSGLSIEIRGGIVDTGCKDSTLLENIDDWRLNLADWRWERLTDRKWPRLEIVRSDFKPNHLWEIKEALWGKTVGCHTNLEASLNRLATYGLNPNLEVAVQLYHPEFPHEDVLKNVDTEDEYDVFRIKINGVVVRYVESMHSVQLTAEGELPQDIIDRLGNDLLHKMQQLENTSCQLRKLTKPNT